MSLGSSADELFTAPLTRKLVGKKKKEPVASVILNQGSHTAQISSTRPFCEHQGY